MDLSAVIEALLIASEEPLPSSELARLVRARLADIEDGGAEEDEDYGKASELADDLKQLSAIDEEAVIEAISNLNKKYDRSKRSFSIIERSKGWKIYTQPEYGGFIRQLFPGLKPRRLSPPAMETLAIIAYRQPVTKASIEHVRGVSTDSILQKLLDRELVKIEGRADLPGRPLLYATTDFFFEHFGIKSIDELPNSAELRAVELPEPPAPEEGEEGDEGEEKQLALVEPNGEPAPPEKLPEDFSAPEPDSGPTTN
jgi:segregation and condensation protein B